MDSDYQRGDLVSKSVNVLDACHWVNLAVKDINASTVEKCFAKAGIVSQPITDDDDDDNLPLAHLLETAAEQLHLGEPLYVESYNAMDSAAPATEQLPQPLNSWPMGGRRR